MRQCTNRRSSWPLSPLLLLNHAREALAQPQMAVLIKRETPSVAAWQAKGYQLSVGGAAALASGASAQEIAFYSWPPGNARHHLQ
jgi:hypothetical protein